MTMANRIHGELLPVRAATERPIRSNRMGLSSFEASRRLTLHELHEFVLGVIHDLSRDRGRAALFRESLNFLSGHGTNEVGNVVETLLRFRRPGHSVG